MINGTRNKIKNLKEKRKKSLRGFSLVELLGVIILLTVIFMIATPIVLNVVEDARKSAFASTVSSLVKITENDCLQSRIFGEPEDHYIVFENGQQEGEKISFSGRAPETGTIYVTTDCKVAYTLHDGNWCAVKTFESANAETHKISPEQCNFEYFGISTTEGIFELIALGYLPISSIEDLQAIGQGEADRIWGESSRFSVQGTGTMTSNYVIVQNLDLTSVNFEPIGYQIGNGYDSFEGIINGYNHTLSNGDIDFLGDNYIGGLVAYLGNNGIIRNINLEDYYVRGNLNVGGIAGLNNGVIQNASFTLTVEGTDNVGGIAGNNQGDIFNSEVTSVLIGENQSFGNDIGLICGAGTCPLVTNGNTAVGDIIYNFYDIVFNANGGAFTTIEGNPVTVTSTVARNTVTSEPEIPTRQHYEFLWWLDGATPYNFSNLVTSGKTLQAHWGVTLEISAPFEPTWTVLATSITADISLVANADQYRIKQTSETEWSEWAGNNVFTNLLPYTEYDFQARSLDPSVLGSIATYRTPKLDNDVPEFTGTINWTIQVGNVTAEVPNVGVGAEYRVNGGSWQTGRTFSSLNPNVEYTFEARMAETGTHNASLVSSPIIETSPKANQTIGTLGSPSWTVQEGTVTASLPALTGATHYRVNGGTWQTGTTFASLSPVVEYTFEARKAETATLNEVISNSVASTSPKANQAAPAQPSSSNLLFDRVTITGAAGTQVRQGVAGTGYNTPYTFTGLTQNTSYSFYAFRPATATLNASPNSVARTVTTPLQVVAPGLPGAFTSPSGTLFRNQTVTVTWGGTGSWGVPTSGQNYRLEIQYDAGAWNLVANNGTSTTRSHTLASAGNSVRFRVRAENSSAQSDWRYSSTLTLTSPAWVLTTDNYPSTHYSGCDTRKNRLQIGSSWVYGVGTIATTPDGCSNASGVTIWSGDFHLYEWRVTFLSGPDTSVWGSNATLRAEWPYTLLYGYDPQFTSAGQSFIFDSARHITGSQWIFAPEETYGTSYLRVERRLKVN